MKWIRSSDGYAAIRIEREWEYLRDESFWKLWVLLSLCGVFPIALDRWLLQPHQVTPIALLLFAALIAGYGFSRINVRLGIVGLVTGVAIATWLATLWWPGPGAATLFLLPVSLATFVLGWQAGVLVGVPMIATLLLRPLGVPPHVVITEGVAVIFLIGVTWALGWISEAPRQMILERLFVYYQRAHTLLEEAREHRLALNQANEDLAEAYAQLSRLYELLRASRMEAEEARRAKEEFVANVSHELRTPLNMIIGFSEMIAHSPSTYGSRLPKALLSDIGVIYRNAQHLAQLINDVLDLSQIEAGRFSLSREWADLSCIIDEAAQAVAPLYRAKGLYLDVDLPSSLPAVYCDRLRARQVILNLLSNAGRFTETGGVTISATMDQDYVVIRVRDTGPGIRPEDQDRIFEPFQQLDGSTKRPHDGSGLGLSISRRLVELHGGKMWLESEPGVGTTFFFSLPLKPDEPSNGRVMSGAKRWVNPYAAHESRPRRSQVELPKPKPRFLIVERDPVLSRQAPVLFEGVDVVAVRDLEEAERALVKDPPEVLLINDAQVMETRGLIRRLMDLPDRTVVVSCYIPGKMEACERLSVVDYLVKPVTRAALLAAAERVAPARGSILIVEDDQTMARLIARQLASAGRGYRTLRAGDGANALALMRERQPDAVFLDLGLPDRDGYQVLEEKNADPRIRHIPVVIVSARDPWGEPVVASRLRVELTGGLSARDILMCAMGLSRSLAPAWPSRAPEPPEMPAG